MTDKDADFRPSALDEVLDGEASTDNLVAGPDKGDGGEGDQEAEKAKVEADTADGAGGDQGDDPDLGGDTDADGEADAAGDKKDDKASPPGAGEKSTDDPDDKRVQGLTAALQAERKARQEAERRADEAAAKRQEKSQRPDEFDDPEGARKWDKQEADNEAYNARAALSRDLMMEIKGEAEYLEKETAFIEAAKDDPALAYKLRTSPNPAKLAYQEGAKILLLKSIGDDPAAYEKRIREDERKRIEADKAKSSDSDTDGDGKKDKKSDARLPTSLADTNSDAPRDPVFEGPTPLDKIIP